MLGEVKFRSAAAFAQSVRMRLNASDQEVQFLVVEGISDKKSFSPLLARHFQYVPARGKEMVLEARSLLREEESERCLFVVDCDGGTDPKWLGQDNLIVSSNRDIDADLLMELTTFDRVAVEYLSDFGWDADTCEDVGRTLLDYANTIATALGIILDHARAFNLPIKVRDAVTNKRRRLQFGDIPGASTVVENFVPVTEQDLIDSVRDVLGWTAEQEQLVREAAVFASEKNCRLHATAACVHCRARTFSNGHDLVEVLALGLTQRCGFEVTPAELARAIRLATSRDTMLGWAVSDRIVRWLESKGGMSES